MYAVNFYLKCWRHSAGGAPSVEAQMIANSARQVTGWVSFFTSWLRGCKLRASKHWANLRKWLTNTFLSFQRVLRLSSYAWWWSSRMLKFVFHFLFNQHFIVFVSSFIYFYKLFISKAKSQYNHSNIYKWFFRIILLDAL